MLTRPRTAVAARVNNAFTPRAVFSTRIEQWFVPCNATAPSLEVVIGGKTLKTDPTSMILPEVRATNGMCSTGIAAASARGPFILGDTFMQGLVSVFDTKKMEMRFAKRT
jgi:hypothetical protein